MRIEQRTVGRVTVLDLQGKITLAEGSDQLKDVMATLIRSGRTLVVLNMGGVPYLDSSGLMEVARAFYDTHRAGGRLWLSDPTKRVLDLLSITKLLTVFDTVTEQDIPGLEAHGPLRAECPICRPATRASVVPGDNTARCSGCGVELTFRPAVWLAGTAQQTYPCERLVMPTYDGERIELSAGTRDQVEVRNRFDLFVFELFERLWHLLARPHRLVLTVNYAGTSPAALRALLALHARANDGSLMAIVMPDIPDDASRLFGGTDLIHHTLAEAQRQVPTDERRSRGIPIRLTRD